MTGEPLDYLTVLTTKGRLATKPLATKRITHTPGGFVVEPYGRAQQFEMQEWGVSSIDDLARVLRTLERHFDSCIIRGRPKPGTHCFSAKRRVRDRRNPDGTVTPATIEPAARQWIALDCDRMACPDWLDPVFEPDRTVEYVVSRLPAEFHDATCWWQFTASQQIKPGISMRLFFWADRPLSDTELKIWLADSPVDHAIFSPAQPIYVAWPIFVGMPDPVPFRSGVCRGDRDAITPPPIEQARSRAKQSSAAVAGEPGRGYENHRSRIGDHAAGDRFFRPVKSAVAAWIAQHGAAADTAWLRADLERSIREAPRDPAKHDDDYIEIRIADLEPLIEAITELQVGKEADAAAIQPTYPAPVGSVEEARAMMEAEMDRFFDDVVAYHADLKRLAECRGFAAA
jgi:hypothetical protein